MVFKKGEPNPNPKKEKKVEVEKTNKVRKIYIVLNSEKLGISEMAAKLKKLDPIDFYIINYSDIVEIIQASEPIQTVDVQVIQRRIDTGRYVSPEQMRYYHLNKQVREETLQTPTSIDDFYPWAKKKAEEYQKLNRSFREAVIIKDIDLEKEIKKYSE